MSAASPGVPSLLAKSFKSYFHETALIVLIVVAFAIVDLVPISIWYLLIRAFTS